MWLQGASVRSVLVQWGKQSGKAEQRYERERVRERDVDVQKWKVEVQKWKIEVQKLKVEVQKWKVELQKWKGRWW